MSIGDRIIQVRKELKITQSEFAEKIGVARNTITSYETNIRTPMENTIKLICREYKVDYMWLTTGEGEMFTDVPETIMDELALEYNLDETDKRILNAYLRLDETQRSVFKKYMMEAFGK